ncbi:MAG: acylneuraminate cytidylyltransferase family protein [Candidatus Buchananbacteria bacterium]
MSLLKKEKIWAIIPARGGSQGVPGKNIKIFCGKPLIYYSIVAAKRAKIFDRILVSTDSSEIAKISKKYGAEVPFLRPKKLAGSKANIVDAIIHLLDKIKADAGDEPDVIFLLQPTSPLRQAQDIVGSYQYFKKNNSLALVSVCQTHQQIYHLGANNLLSLVNRETEKVINRQESPKAYRQDGSMIYIIRVDQFRKYHSFMPKEKTVGYVIEKWKAIDIDDFDDWQLAEVIYSKRKKFISNNQAI